MFLFKECVALLTFCAVLTAGLNTAEEHRREHSPAFLIPAHLCLYAKFLDKEMGANDDGHSNPVVIPHKFKFYGRKYKRLFVNTNGLITFSNPLTAYTPECFPLKNIVAIAPYWADVDTTQHEGRVYYRAWPSPYAIQQISGYVKKAFHNNFKANWLFFATWHGVTYHGASPSESVRTKLMNTFQVVLAINNQQSYVIFNYGDMAWTTGRSSGGDENGLGGTPAEMGFNAGDGKRYYTQFGSLTPDIIDIRTQTNCGVRGRFIFRVDGKEVLFPRPSPYDHFRPNRGRSPAAYAGKGGKV